MFETESLTSKVKILWLQGNTLYHQTEMFPINLLQFVEASVMFSLIRYTIGLYLCLESQTFIVPARPREVLFCLLRQLPNYRSHEIILIYETGNKLCLICKEKINEYFKQLFNNEKTNYCVCVH